MLGMFGGVLPNGALWIRHPDNVPAPLLCTAVSLVFLDLHKLYCGLDPTLE